MCAIVIKKGDCFYCGNSLLVINGENLHLVGKCAPENWEYIGNLTEE